MEHPEEGMEKREERENHYNDIIKYVCKDDPGHKDEHDDPYEGNSELAEFARHKFKGANITITLINGEEISGEVVFDFCNPFAIKAGDTIYFINAKDIVTFR